MGQRPGRLSDAAPEHAGQIGQDQTSGLALALMSCGRFQVMSRNFDAGSGRIRHLDRHANEDHPILSFRRIWSKVPGNGNCNFSLSSLLQRTFRHFARHDFTDRSRVL